MGVDISLTALHTANSFVIMDRLLHRHLLFAVQVGQDKYVLLSVRKRLVR